MSATRALSVRSLAKKFGALVVAQAIDLDLAPGARMALIGPNGAGKTTFVNLLTGFLEPDDGRIELWGRSLRGLRQEILHASLRARARATPDGKCAAATRKTAIPCGPAPPGGSGFDQPRGAGRAKGACTLARSPYFVTRYPKASDISSPPCLLRLLPAGTICRVGLAPTGKRRLVTAHTHVGRCSIPSRSPKADVCRTRRPAA
jgi:energy-coupling factor transporter ATP-binding protein EcfA2